MTFLNATLVLGTLAAIVPIVLHLIARREPRKVVFPSIAFLTKRYDSNRSKLRVRRWWLLALRIAAVASLAVALARPAIHQSLSLTWLTIGLIAATGVALVAMASVALAKGQSRNVTVGLASGAATALLAAIGWGIYAFASGPAVSIESNPPVAIAILMDNSPTSEWRSSDDTKIERMRETAAWVAAQLPRTSRISIVDRGGGPVAFSLDVGGAISKIEQISPRQTVQPIASRIDAAARLLRTSELENRQILVITDLATSTWTESTSESELIKTLGMDPAIGVVLFDLGAMSGSNRSLSIPKIADPTPPRGVPVAISTTLTRNPVTTGTDSTTTDADSTTTDGGSSTEADVVSVTAELELFASDPSLPVVRDGNVVYPALRSVDRTSVRLESGGSAELLMTIPELSVGTHHGQVRLIGDDALGLDDVRFFSLSVLPPSSILLVCDDKDEASIIGQVISASPVIAEDGNSEFQVERIGVNDLSVARLSDYDVVVLLNPPPSVLSDSTIADYVGGGGGVLIAVGPAAGNQPVESPYAPSLVLRWRVPDPGAFMQVVAGTHPVTGVVSQDTPWTDFRIAQYWQVSPLAGDRVLMQFAGTDHAALVERLSSGTGPKRGRVLMLATPIPAVAQSTRSWNELFGTDPWPAWLLVRQSIEYLAGRSDSDSMAWVGSPHVVPLQPPNSDPSDLAAPSTRLQLFPPGGSSPVPMEISPSADQVVVNEVPIAGTYWLRGAQTGLGFSANLPPEAISTARIGTAELDGILGPASYVLATQRDEIQLSDNQAASRVSLHSPAMLLALIVFLLEQILGNRFYRSK